MVRTIIEYKRCCACGNLGYWPNKWCSLECLKEHSFRPDPIEPVSLLRVWWSKFRKFLEVPCSK